MLALPGVHLHLYGKASARVGRKMGHLTLTGDRMPARPRATADDAGLRAAGLAAPAHDDGSRRHRSRSAARGGRLAGRWRQLVAFPTETVYGLGARADDDAAVAGIFNAKGRPADHPLIVHVCDVAAARQFASHWSERAQRLTAAFWPGPLTVIVPRRPGQATASRWQAKTVWACAALPTQWPGPCWPRPLCRVWPAWQPPTRQTASGGSAPPQARHVAAEFDDGLLVLDGGDCDVGIESAIVDLHPASAPCCCARAC